MIITGVRLCGRHLQLRRLLICNCEKLSISARLMQRLHHWPHQLPAGSELIRLLLLMGQRRRWERKGAALSINVPAAPLLASDTGCSGAASAPPALEEAGCEVGTALDMGASAGMLRSDPSHSPTAGSTMPCPWELCMRRTPVHTATGSAHTHASEQTGSAAVTRCLCTGEFCGTALWTAALCLDGLPPQEPSVAGMVHLPAALLRSPGAWCGHAVHFACPGFGLSVTGEQASISSLSSGGACCTCGHPKQRTSFLQSNLEAETKWVLRYCCFFPRRGGVRCQLSANCVS